MTTSYGDTWHSSPDPPKLLHSRLITLPEAGRQEQSPGTTRGAGTRRRQDMCPVGLPPDSRLRKRLWPPKSKAPHASPSPRQLSLHSPAGPGKSLLTLLVTGASLIPTREDRVTHADRRESGTMPTLSRALRKPKAENPQAFTAPTVSFPEYPLPSKNRHIPSQGTQPTHSLGSQDHSCCSPNHSLT